MAKAKAPAAKPKPGRKVDPPAKAKPGGKASPPSKSKAMKGPRAKATGRTRKTDDPAKQLRERIALAEKICADYATGEFTIDSCAQNHGIAYDTFASWRRAHPEISEIYKAACESYREEKFNRLRPLALNSFERLVAGYDYEETQTTAKVQIGPDGKQQIVPDRIVKTKHHVSPSPGMVAMAMRNWHGMRDRLDVNHSGTITTRQVMVIGGKEIEF